MCVLVNNNFCGKLVSSLELPITFDESFTVASVPFFILNFNSLRCQLYNFTFKKLYWVISYWYYIKKCKIKVKIHNTFIALREKSKSVSFASSIIKNNVFSGWCRFPFDLICCVIISLTCCDLLIVIVCSNYVNWVN